MAALHFNYNLRRKPGTDKNGNPKLRVSYPKFKGGEATVREVRGVQNYGMYITTPAMYGCHVNSQVVKHKTKIIFNTKQQQKE